MRLIYLLRFFLFIRYFFHKISRTGSFSPRHRVDFITEPTPSKAGSLKELLHHYHIKQYHESSCSVASVAAAVNALAHRQGTPFNPPLTQQDLLATVKAAHWKARMEPEGHNGRRGLPLSLLGEVVKDSLETHGIAHTRVEIIQAPAPKSLEAQATRRRLKSLMTGFETTGDCLLLAHFDQGRFIRELNIPHISPVGGYHADTGQVTILDVDPGLPHPYEISFSTFYRGIGEGYANLFRFFGYGRGGCVVIHL